jgi:universal stress protein A
MRPYQHVLFATDLSEGDEVGALRAAELARKFHARLTLLHVVPEFPEDNPVDPVAPENVDPAEFLVTRARRALERLAHRIGHPQAETKVVFSTGSAKHAIVDVAEGVGADLILLAASGHHLLPAWLTTTTGVLNDACCDVMIVRKGEDAAIELAAARRSRHSRYPRRRA